MFTAGCGQLGAGPLSLVSSPLHITLAKTTSRRNNRTVRAVASDTNAPKSPAITENLQDPEAPYFR
jgi:hypothetical protein